jgi:hypothetical protein
VCCRKNPKVEKHRSAVHELYMRPYNYVSYEMGGAKPTHYHYHSPSPSYSIPTDSYDSSPTAYSVPTDSYDSPPSPYSNGDSSYPASYSPYIPSNAESYPTSPAAPSYSTYSQENIFSETIFT